MTIILGIDPGSIITGYGLISCCNHTINYINSGNLKIKINNNFFQRLKLLYYAIKTIIKKYNPNISVLEHIFIAKNYNANIKLSYARSSILLALINNQIPLVEYSAIKIKYIITGIKQANKLDMQNAMKLKFNFSKLPKKDEADALAIALTYYYLNIFNKKICY